MKRLLSSSKKLLIMLMVLTLIVTSSSFSFVSYASAIDGYKVKDNNNKITCRYKGEAQKGKYLFLLSNDDGYCVVDGDDKGSLLYYFDKDGVGSAFTGIYDGKYYENGKLGKASKNYYKVIKGKLYKIKRNANAEVYRKDTSKSGNYQMVVDGSCYNVSYKTGNVSGYTGVYSGKYYKSGSVATSSSDYYVVFESKLYKVTKSGKTQVYKKDVKKSGKYCMLVDGVCYSVTYKSGKVSKFSGKYNGKFYKNGKLANGWCSEGKNNYYCNSGVPVKGVKKIKNKVYYFDGKGVKFTGSGWKTISNKKYYFTKGVATTGWTLIGKYMYNFTSTGELVKSKKVDGINLDANGKATGPAKKYVPRYAKLLTKQITSSKNTKAENLRICFDYVINTYKSNGNPRIPHYTKEDWIYVYANDMFGERGGGNCFSYAAAFAFLAKECGYKEVYGCNSSGHGWTEIDGKVYDPEQYKDCGKKIYGWSYSDKRIGNYKGAIAGQKNNPWMHVAIPG